MHAGRIYPVPVKPRTTINTWSGWPDDVRETLRRWNGGHRGLSFRRSATGSLYEPSVSVFKCVDCESFCEAHPHGAAQLKGDWLCDECLIARARSGPDPSKCGPPEHGASLEPGGLPKP